MTSANRPDARPLRILMLHGFTQSGNLFSQKTGALKKAVTKAFSALSPPVSVVFHFPTAPIRLRPADIPGFDTLRQNADGISTDTADPEEVDSWAWFQRSGKEEPCTYTGFPETLEILAGVLKNEGPFDGVVGFSQGGFMASVMASLLETGRPEAFERLEVKGGMAYPPALKTCGHPPFKFAVSYSGFGSTKNPLYDALYNPKITTPMLHFIGSVDTVVSEERSMRLVDGCEGGSGEGGRRVVYHPGGHFVPASQKQYQRALIDFITETMEFGKDDKSKNGAKEVEERVEDMDMPF